MPSVQLANYLQARADGHSVEDACEASGIGLGEAKLHEKDIESGELSLPPARARAPARTREGEPTKETKVDNVQTTMRIGDGPELPINLSDPDDPANDQAKVAIAESIGRARHGNVAADELRLLIERVERLEEERKGLAEDIADVFGEAKARGFDKAAMKQCIKLRRMEPRKLQEAEAILHTYMDALGLNAFESHVALGIAA